MTSHSSTVTSPSSPMLSTPSDIPLPPGVNSGSSSSSSSSSSVKNDSHQLPLSTSYQMDPAMYKRLLQLPGNDTCIECGNAKRRPDWGDPKMGLLFCFNCAGRFRGLGTHIAFVRSVTMDSWTPPQIQAMLLSGGNEAFAQFMHDQGNLDIHAIDNDSNGQAMEFRHKYDNPTAELYRQKLLARVQNRPEPTQLLSSTTPASMAMASSLATGNLVTSHHNRSATSASLPRRMEGFGSSPPPPPASNSSFENAKWVIIPAAAVAISVTAWLLLPGGT